MLQSFSDRIRNSRWLGYTIVAAISIPFALWGVQAYFQGADPQVAAKVNGEPIQERQVSQAVTSRRQQLQQRFDGQLPDAFTDGMLRQQVLEQLITRELLRQRAEEAGLRVTDARVAAKIRQQEPFQRDGGFDREVYRQRLSQVGLSPEQYEERVRRGDQVQQLRNGVSESALLFDAEARLAARLGDEARRVAVVERTRDGLAQSVELTDEAIRSYYESNKERFETPRRVRVRYIELTLEDLGAQIEIPEEELRAQYEANQEQYRAAAERKASHILIQLADEAGEEAQRQAREKAERLAERARQGGDFDALAKQYSDDPGSASEGGDLGYVGRGDMATPFEEALFELDEPGAVAGPVETSFGYHVIKLEDVREPKPKPFEAVRDEIREKLAQQRAERLFYDRVEVLKNEAYENPGSLGPAAEAVGLEIQQSDWFSRREGEGIASAQAIRQKAFSEPVLDEGRNSEIVELGERRVAVVRVSGERPPETKPLEAVRDPIREQLTQRRVEQKLEDWAGETVAQLRNGASMASLAETDGVSFSDAGWVKRSGGDLEQGLAQTAFELALPDGEGTGYTTTSTRNGRAVVAVRGSRLPEVGDEAVETARQRLRQGISRAELRAWIEGLKSEAEIVRHDPPDQRQGGAGRSQR